MWTKEKKLEWQRKHRKANANVETLRYEKTPKGFLMRKYRNMQSRVKGIQKSKYHLYKNLSILSRDDFYRWANRSMIFWKLFYEWKKKDYDRRLCPSVDRIDSKKGYEIENMEWVTHSENSSRGAINQHKMKI